MINKFSKLQSNSKEIKNYGISHKNIIAKHRKHFFTRTLSLILITLASKTVWATDYSFVDLGYDFNKQIGALQLNNNNQVVGYIQRGDPATYKQIEAAYWDNGQWHILDAPVSTPADHKDWNAAWDINDHGQVVGFFGPYWQTEDDSYAVRWDNGLPARLDDLPGNTWATYAFGINNNGLVSGVSWVNNTFHTVKWNPGETAVQDLGTLGGSTSISPPGAINDAGQIVGWANTANDDAVRATVWASDNSIHDLGTLGGNNSQAYNINNLGQIVGQAQIADDLASHAALWNDEHTAAIDLGTLGGANSQAQGINDLGQIIGWSDTADGKIHITLWENGQIIDLDSYIPADLQAAGWTFGPTGIQGGGFINNQGVILGELYDAAGNQRPFLLTPVSVPVPATAWLLGSGLIGLVRFRRRA